MRGARQQLRAIEPRRAALFLAVFALAAGAMYCGGREAGVGRPTEAGTTVAQERTSDLVPQDNGEEKGGESDFEPLALRLTAPEICDAYPAKGGWTHTLEPDGEGNWLDAIDEVWWDWDSVGTMEITWEAAGGDGSYVVTIAGEIYTGGRGTAEVSCALEHGPVIDHPEWGRIHAGDDEPVVDSGFRTIVASVSDSSGASATAVAEVYMVFNRGLGGAFYRNGEWQHDCILGSGKTYRMDDTPMTVLQSVDLCVHEIIEFSPGKDHRGRCCSVWIIGIVGSNRILVLWDNSGGLPYAESGRAIITDDYEGPLWDWNDSPKAQAARARQRALEVAGAIDADRAFDEFLASFGRLPQSAGG